MVLANNCQDRTYLFIKEYQNIYPEFPLLVEEIAFAEEEANVGTARRLLMDIAYHRFTLLNKNGIIGINRW